MIAEDPDACPLYLRQFKRFIAIIYLPQLVYNFSAKMPAVLGRLLMPPLRRMELSSVRLINIYGTVQPKPALKQLTVNEVGHFRYERDRSRDSKMANPQKLGDTPIR